jgi:adenylate kinase
VKAGTPLSSFKSAARPDAILLLGPTGSGKTPLGELLAEYGFGGRPCAHFDFGERLRRAADAPPDALSAYDVAFIRSILQSTALLEDEQFPIAEAILRGFLAEHSATDNMRIILNGLPRHIGQARDVDAIVRIDSVIELACTPEVVRQRIALNTGGDRSTRTDDDAAAVQRKLAIYAGRIAPLRAHYAALGVRVETIDVQVDTTPADVRAQLEARR